MTTATLISAVGNNQNQAGPPVPANTTANAGGAITRAVFTLAVTPITGWAEAAVQWGPDNLVWPGQASVYCGPGGTGSTDQSLHFHDGGASGGAVGGDDAQYFKAELLSVAPGCTATLTMVY